MLIQLKPVMDIDAEELKAEFDPLSKFMKELPHGRLALRADDN